MELKLLVEFAGGARDENSAGNAAFAVFHALSDASRFAALGAVSALGSVHYFLAICGLGNLGHWLSQVFGCGFILPYAEQSALGSQHSAVSTQPFNLGMHRGFGEILTSYPPSRRRMLSAI
jgi:hypothetical protein